MRKLYLLLTLFVIASFVLAACAPAAATTAPEEEAPAEEVPAEEEAAGAASQYIGSGVLDGNGIPPDFFADVHIRKAFAYAFDFDTYIQEVYLGEAVQPVVLPLAGMPGYNADAPHYSYDLEASAAEFALADSDHDGIPAGEDPEGDVWTTGFRVQMAYNLGNTSRQTVAELMAAGLGAVNELFLVEVLGLPWPSYLTAQRASLIPLQTAGWLEDIHDAHNWYQPYTVGAYGNRQRLPEDLVAQLRDILERGVANPDPAARDAVYQEMNQLYYDQAVGIPFVNATGHNYEQRWVSGRILNPIFPGIYFPTISKSGSPDDTTFTEVTIGDIDTFDPALAYDTASAEVLQNTYDTLVFYDGESTSEFVPSLAESWELSDDGSVYTFHIRSGVTFHDGAEMTPSDVAYSFQRGLLQGSYISPQFLLAEPFFGPGVDDISLLVAEDGSLADDREALAAADPAALVAACEKVTGAIVADDAAGTVTMTLAGPWGPFLPTIAQTWADVVDQDWAISKGAWDGDCATWQNYYAATSDDGRLINEEINGTGPFMLDHRTPGEEIVLVRNPNYWGEAPALERVVILGIDEFGTRFAMLQAGEADWAFVPRENTPQVDPLAGEVCTWNLDSSAYDCETVDDSLPLRMRIGRPGLSQEAIIFTFAIQ
jgi:ABC-type transport system substrate-binding protein